MLDGKNVGIVSILGMRFIIVLFRPSGGGGGDLISRRCCCGV